MALLKGRYELDVANLPSHSDDVHAEWVRRTVGGKNETVLLSPHSDDDFEGSTFVRFFCGIQLAFGDDPTVVQGSGQVVLTDRRLMGMLHDGVASGKQLDVSRGSVYTFSFDHDDAGGPRPTTNWRGKPTHATFHSRASQELSFRVQIFSVVAIVKTDGSVGVTSMGSFLGRFDADGRPKFSSK